MDEICTTSRKIVSQNSVLDRFPNVAIIVFAPERRADCGYTRLARLLETQSLISAMAK